MATLNDKKKKKPAPVGGLGASNVKSRVNSATNALAGAVKRDRAGLGSQPPATTPPTNTLAKTRPTVYSNMKGGAGTKVVGSPSSVGTPSSRTRKSIQHGVPLNSKGAPKSFNKNGLSVSNSTWSKDETKRFNAPISSGGGTRMVRTGFQRTTPDISQPRQQPSGRSDGNWRDYIAKGDVAGAQQSNAMYRMRQDKEADAKVTSANALSRGVDQKAMLQQMKNKGQMDQAILSSEGQSARQLAGFENAEQTSLRERQEALTDKGTTRADVLEDQATTRADVLEDRETTEFGKQRDLWESQQREDTLHERSRREAQDDAEATALAKRMQGGWTYNKAQMDDGDQVVAPSFTDAYGNVATADAMKQHNYMTSGEVGDDEAKVLLDQMRVEDPDMYKQILMIQNAERRRQQ